MEVTMRFITAKLVTLLLALALSASAMMAGSGDTPQQTRLTEAFAEREYFYVGGKYVNVSVVRTSVSTHKQTFGEGLTINFRVTHPKTSIWKGKCTSSD